MELETTTKTEEVIRQAEEIGHLRNELAEQREEVTKLRHSLAGSAAENDKLRHDLRRRAEEIQALTFTIRQLEASDAWGAIARFRNLWQAMNQRRPAPGNGFSPAGQGPLAQRLPYLMKHFDHFQRSPYLLGKCNICGHWTAFFCDNKYLYRESLVCAECLSISRYRSIARGVLQAVRRLTGIGAESLAQLPQTAEGASLKIYDAQVPFRYEHIAYPIPHFLARCEWLKVKTSLHEPAQPWGVKLGPSITNQNLEALTFPDNSFDIVITSDVMEHVRLDALAHREIRRVLKPGGIYLFTVPQLRDHRETMTRVAVVDPSDPAKDQFLMEKEYHGDANSKEGGVLTYRAYGTDLDEALASLGFSVEYCRADFPDIGIINTELFCCSLRK